MANAVQYTPEDGRITTKVELQDGQVVITISDNGIGVPAKDLPTIFDQFQELLMLSKYLMKAQVLGYML